MKLFFNKTSPYARKVRIAVLEKGLADRVDFVETDPWVSPPDLLSVTPLSKVPALLTDDGRVVTESDTIIQVLDLLDGHVQLLPADPTARIDTLARAGLCQGLIDASFISVIEGRRPKPAQWADWVQRLRSAVERALVHANGFSLSPQRFDLGDIALASALGYLDFRLADLGWRQQYPALAAWYDAVAERPSMQATRPD